jgi:hypothetical protein
LQDPLRDKVGVLLDVTGSVDHSPHDGLKEISASGASNCARDGMPERSETVFLRDRRCTMPTENAGEDLNYEICGSPGYCALPLLSLAFLFPHRNGGTVALRFLDRPRQAAQFGTAVATIGDQERDEGAYAYRVGAISDRPALTSAFHQTCARQDSDVG